ncbi:delta-sarcoglycan isoform X2 [Dendroctonus ponderosae]|uniref:delta-sarcoglycan isoform X2 n=1 Tax=Dendroctonus ponderosae TaxID=77166 RepID=UPI0020360CA7|nr:delta-sarcoglycan isoform X2 [Dendroctonus ponderosae]
MLNRRRRKILLASRENSKQSTYYYKQLVKIAESLIIQHNRACLENGQQYVAAKSQLTNNNSDQSLRMKANDGETSTVHSRQEEPMATRSAVFCPPGFRMGMYGWRKKCLYGLILVLLFMVIVNLALTLWVLKVLDFSTDGMGQLEVVPGGLKLKGNAFVLDNLIANQIRSRSGEPIVIESSRNITLRSRDKLGRSSTVVHMGIDSLECLANKFQILDDRGGLLFSADRREVVVGAETLRITGEGGSRFSGSVQTRLVRAESGHDLRLESPTRGLQIRAPKELKLESRGGHINALAQNDVSFRSEMGAIRLQSSSIIVPQLPTAKVTNRQVGARSFEVFQLCACENGKLFLADPHVVCASENEDSFCR